MAEALREVILSGALQKHRTLSAVSVEAEIERSVGEF